MILCIFDSCLTDIDDDYTLQLLDVQHCRPRAATLARTHTHILSQKKRSRPQTHFLRYFCSTRPDQLNYQLSFLGADERTYIKWTSMTETRERPSPTDVNTIAVSSALIQT